MSYSFLKFELSSPLVLAPMAGITDIAFREVCKAHGAAITYSEMVSAKGLVYQDAKSRTLLPRGRGEYPYAVQLFGHEPEVMAEAALKTLELVSPEIIDLNMGCPTPKIVKSGDGCALMQNPELAGRIIESVIKTVGSAAVVTVKFRKGWDDSSVNAPEFAKMCEASGASAVTVHGRTRAQFYSGSADHTVISEVKRAVNIPVIANGDITGLESALGVMELTGADLAMAGRAAMGNPWIFGAQRNVGVKERVETALKQAERTAELKGERTACLEARKHFAWYLKGVRNAVKYKSLAAKAASLNELCEIGEMCLSENLNFLEIKYEADI